MLTKITYDEYWRSWFLDDYKASSGEEAISMVNTVNFRSHENEAYQQLRIKMLEIFFVIKCENIAEA